MLPAQLPRARKLHARILHPLALSFCIGLCGINAHAQDKGEFRGGPGEQYSFSIDSPALDHPVPIPDEAWKILERDQEVRARLKMEHLPVSQLPRTWFSGSITHLHDLAEADLIVQAVGPLARDESTTFWIFLHKQSSYTLAAAFSASFITILPSDKGFDQVIEVSAMDHLSTTGHNYLCNTGAGYKYCGPYKPLNYGQYSSPQTYTLQNIKLQPRERVEGIRIDLYAGSFVSVSPLPIDWEMTITNDPSFQGKMRFEGQVLNASYGLLERELHELVINVNVYDFTHEHFSISGKLIAISSDFNTERAIPLETKDFLRR